MTAAHSITFDNLGEVTALARGEHPAGEPLGRHPSVTRALPRILGLLEATGLRATFFVEGRNTELYPDALAEIAAAGHEVAHHGWCHEAWAGLGPEEEAAVLERGVRALEALGLRPDGFRPPGGALTAATLPLLRDLGFSYCSPAGDAVAVRDGVAVLPFAWPAVDAFHYLDRFAEHRGGDAPHPPAVFAAELARALDAGGPVVFHAFLLTEDDERVAVLEHHLRAVRARVDRGDLWCAPLRDVAARTLS